MLEFCPMCKRLLVQKEYKGRLVGACACGFMRTGGIAISGEENIIQTSQVGAGIVDEKNSSMGGEIERVCKKCGFNKAQASNIEGVEASIFIYKCLACGYSDRESSGGSKV